MSGEFVTTTGQTLHNLGPNTRACHACDYQSRHWPWRAVVDAPVVLASDARWERVCPKCETVCETTGEQG